MKTAADEEQNTNLMEGVESTAKVTGETTGEIQPAASAETSKKPSNRVTLSTASTHVPKHETPHVALLTSPRQEIQQVPALAEIGNNATKQTPEVAIPIENDPTEVPYKFHKIMDCRVPNLQGKELEFRKAVNYGNKQQCEELR